MIDAIFEVKPLGICGMNTLAKFLSTLQAGGGIADWHPMRAESGSKGARYIVQFDSNADADKAMASWKAAA